MRSPLVVATLVLAPLAVAALAQADGPASVTAVDAGGEPSYHFSPANVKVDAGGEISVIGGTVEAHTFTHDVPVNDRLFDSGQVSVGQTKLVRAPTTPGRYPFRCTYHAVMVGVLNVGTPPTPTPTPTMMTGVPGPGAALVTLALAGGAVLLTRHRR